MLLLPVKTRATRVALLRYAGLDAPQHALFAAVRPDLKAKNMRLFCPLDLLFTSVSEKVFSYKVITAMKAHFEARISASVELALPQKK
jgi:hypothetical protein